jgi:hypothetical protein
VWDLEVEGVGPDGRVGERCRNGAVVDEAELLHHEELTVPAGLEEGHAESSNFLDFDSAKTVDDVGLKSG